ncbi:MAG: hypothetical protein HYR91_09075 [Flavobacteriia bacterium]|nr:hypothetical protein [Flavobacteriia bacterium]
MNLENEHIRFWIEDGILFSEYKQPFNMTLENSKDIYMLRETISNGNPQYFCYDICNLKSMTKEARDYGEKYGQNLLIASSIVVNSHLTLFLYNTFLKIKKVKIPVKAFKDKKDAVEWLNELRKQKQSNV